MTDEPRGQERPETFRGLLLPVVFVIGFLVIAGGVLYMTATVGAPHVVLDPAGEPAP